MLCGCFLKRVVKYCVIDYVDSAHSLNYCIVGHIIYISMMAVA